MGTNQLARLIALILLLANILPQTQAVLSEIPGLYIGISGPTQTSSRSGTPHLLTTLPVVTTSKRHGEAPSPASSPTASPSSIL